MNTINHIFAPYSIPISDGIVESLYETKERSENASSDVSRLTLEKELVDAIVTHASELLNPSRITKTLINLVDGSEINLPPNCTDDTASQLRICDALGYSAFAKFNGHHASTVLPIGQRYWRVNGPNTFSVSRSDAPARVSDGVDISRVATAIHRLDETDASYAYVWEDMESQQWGSSFFNGVFPRKTDEEVGGQSHMPERISKNSYVLMRSVVAYQSLRAIDIINMLAGSQPDSNLILQEALPILRPYVPKLNYS